MDYFKFAKDNALAQAAEVGRTLEQMEKDYIAPAAQACMDANSMPVAYEGDAGDETEVPR